MSGEISVQLWKNYIQTRDPAIKEQIINEYAYLIKYVAGRLSIYFGANIEFIYSIN
jgi:RNA polymerase sigma factor for flagellar operon FliA